MNREAIVTRVECPACGHRLMDKKDGAVGKVQVKCQKSKHVWEVDLGTDEFKLISGRPIPRRQGVRKLEG